MGKFFQSVFASCLGVFLAFLVIFAVGSMIMGAFISKASKSEGAKANSVLVVKLNDVLPEKSNNVPMDPYDFNTEKILGVHDMALAIKKAKDDDDIKGILLDMSGVQAGRVTASVVREALDEFKSDGKFIVSYGQYYTQGSYYMASVADKVFLNPIGDVDFRGFASMVPFFKDMLDRLGIKMQIFYAGKFKSATEPYRRNDMSPENKLQVREYLEGMYDLYLEDIASSRDVSKTELRRIADEYAVRKAEDAVDVGLVDELAYRDEVYSYLRKKLGLEEDDKLPSISLNAYAKANPKKLNITAKNRIAVVYAEGTLVDGQGENGSIGGDKYAKLIRKIRKDKKVKAIVLRVNSPGGSVWASENILRELQVAQDQGLPVIASMGDLAASGGYYISCSADSIFASPSTITGSIGVFATIPSVESMLEEKVGVRFDTVKTGPFATGISPFMDIGPEMAPILQKQVEEIYDLFLTRVSKGRDMTVEEVHKIAQGRVWTGVKGKELGLVDRLGGLNDAINSAAIMADLDDYRVKEYPTIKDPIEELMEKITGADKSVAIQETMLKSQLGELYPYYKQLKEIQEMKGIQARMPFVINMY